MKCIRKTSIQNTHFLTEHYAILLSLGLFQYYNYWITQCVVGQTLRQIYWLYVKP